MVLQLMFCVLGKHFSIKKKCSKKMADGIEDLPEIKFSRMHQEEVPPIYPGADYLLSGHPISSTQSVHFVPPGLIPINGQSGLDPSPIHQAVPYYSPSHAHALSPMTGSLTSSTAALATAPLDGSMPSSVGLDFPPPDMAHRPVCTATPVSSVTSGVSPPHNLSLNPNPVTVPMSIPVQMAPVASSPSLLCAMQYPTQHQYPSSFPSLAHGNPGHPYYFSCPPFPYSAGSLHSQPPVHSHSPVAGPVPFYFTPHTAPQLAYSQPVLSTQTFAPLTVPPVPVPSGGQSSLTAVAATTAATTIAVRRTGGKDRPSIFQERARVSVSTRRGEPPEVSSKDAAEAKKAELMQAGPRAAIAYMRENEKHIEVLMMSPCGNHLLQALVKLSPDVVGSIILNSTTYNEDIFRMIIKGKCSCWVLQAIFSCGYVHDKTFEDLLIKHHEEIAKSEYGNFVLQRAIECPQFQFFDTLSEHLLLSFQSICGCKYGSHVAECLIKTLSARSKLDAAAYWLFTQPYFYGLIIDQHGCFVVEKIAEVATGEVKTCCLRIVKYVISLFAPGSQPHEAAELLGITQQITPNLVENINSILYSVKLRCRTINKSFESMVPMSQKDLHAFLKDRNISVVGPMGCSDAM